MGLSGLSSARLSEGALKRASEGKLGGSLSISLISSWTIVVNREVALLCQRLEETMKNRAGDITYTKRKTKELLRVQLLSLDVIY